MSDQYSNDKATRPCESGRELPIRTSSQRILDQINLSEEQSHLEDKFGLNQNELKNLISQGPANTKTEDHDPSLVTKPLIVPKLSQEASENEKKERVETREALEVRSKKEVQMCSHDEAICS